MIVKTLSFVIIYLIKQFLTKEEIKPEKIILVTLLYCYTKPTLEKILIRFVKDIPQYLEVFALPFFF